jgi:hypothetical protein
MAKRVDILLGQYLVQKQHCPLRQVNEALLQQARLRTGNAKHPLGRILIEMGAITEETLRMSLADLGVLKLSCPSCRTEYQVDHYERDSVMLCSTCREALVLSDPESGGRGDARGPATPVPPSQTPRAPQTGAPEAPAAPANGAPSAEAKDSYLGKVFGGCQIIAKVGHGGMGIVYKAKQLNLGRIVAVKILSSELSKDSSFVRRFFQEARSAAQLNHGNIVHINDVGEHQGVYYFVMEFVDGRNLKEILKTGWKAPAEGEPKSVDAAQERLDVAFAVDIALQVCQALKHAHNRGIIHRDIKPENIMLTGEGVAKLADLGLAKRVASEGAAGMTHAGSIFGTPFYMAPEQAKDFSKVDARSDIYSLGVTLYKMLTGKVPFDGRSPIEVMIKAIDGKRVPVRELREDVPKDLEEIVDRMMHRLPEKRYQQVDDVIADLTRAHDLASTA